MSILHQSLLIVIYQLFSLTLPLLEWVIYDYLAPKYKKRWLVQLETVLDLTLLELTIEFIVAVIQSAISQKPR